MLFGEKREEEELALLRCRRDIWAASSRTGQAPLAVKGSRVSEPSPSWKSASVLLPVYHALWILLIPLTVGRILELEGRV